MLGMEVGIVKGDGQAQGYQSVNGPDQDNLPTSELIQNLTLSAQSGGGEGGIGSARHSLSSVVRPISFHLRTLCASIRP